MTVVSRREIECTTRDEAIAKFLLDRAADRPNCHGLGHRNAEWRLLALAMAREIGETRIASRETLLAQWRNGPATIDLAEGKSETMTNTPSSIITALSNLSPAVLSSSGAAFYTGSAAFEGACRLYILGLNPGGSPEAQARNTVQADINSWTLMPARYSRYLDECWEGKAPGTHGLQPRMKHMADTVGIDLRSTPASNLVFVRSRSEACLASAKTRLIRECWPVHQAVLRELSIDTILCLGGTAGRWTRELVGATHLTDDYRETNARGWVSEAHGAPDGTMVITVSHPGRANWCNSTSDPSALIRRVLNRKR